MFAVTSLARGFSRPKQQPVVRLLRNSHPNLYFQSLLGLSNSMYYTKYSIVSSNTYRETYRENLTEYFLDVHREITSGGVVLSGANLVARGNSLRDCSWSVHFGRCISS